MAQTLLMCICGLFLYIPVYGLDRGRTITQFHHTAWTAKDGAPSQITALAQTEDGYLWIGSERGLFRFDGVQFELYEPPVGVTLPSHSINSLMATPDGGLWVSFNPSGVAFLKGSQIRLFSPSEGLPRSEVYCFARDLDGRIWGGAHTGLVLFDGSRWLAIANDWNFTNHRIWTMYIDRNGTLWVATDDTIVFLPRGSKKFQHTGGRFRGVLRIAQAKDGRLWMSEWDGPTRPIPLADRNAVTKGPEILGNAVRFLFDREGSLWLVGGTGGVVRRVRFPERLGNRKLAPDDPEMESFKVHNGLTDNTVNNVFEDREGNIWVSSYKGLDRFRHSHLVPVNLPTGYRDLTLLAGENGDVWVASASQKRLVRIRDQDIRPQSPPMDIASVHRDSNGVVWWGGHGGIWRQFNGRFDFFPQPKGTTFDWLWEVVPDGSGGGLWVGLGDSGLIHFKDGVWTDRRQPSGLPNLGVSASYRDPSGRIWLGYNDNSIYLLDGDRVQAYSHNDGIDIGRIRAIRGSRPQMWLGGELGLVFFDNRRFRRVATAGGEPFGTVSGIVETPDGALWLNELHGIVRISPEEVRRVAENPNHAITYQVFGFLDGLPGGPQMNIRCSTAIEATDGRLWFATDNGLAWIDPTRISKNMVPPPVSIRSLATEVKKYEPSASLDLPQKTASLRIVYTALSLSVPERVRFRYKLEGVDHDWQDAGTRRQAFYNNLRPGNYRFRVIACNNDGIWNDEGAALAFSIAPAWYQTNWFLLLCIMTGIFVAWALYWLRMQHIAKTISAHFDERLAERTRIARELHDTLLQTVQGSKMVADDALEQAGDPVRLRQTMEQLSGWLGQAVSEGRAALNSLRTSTIEKNDLSEALRRATETCRNSGSMEVSFSVAGDPREMHPIVRDEVYRIGYEAILNACAHSRASRLKVELRYTQDLVMRVSDDGIGIDPVITNKGKESHFGLQGMRERAARIGAKLALVSSATDGTEITLVVPGAIVFQKTNATRFERIRDVFRK
jgi:signal transduction histidine kinase/ligand-binding sensor domain-containing protein